MRVRQLAACTHLSDAVGSKRLFGIVRRVLFGGRVHVAHMQKHHMQKQHMQKHRRVWWHTRVPCNLSFISVSLDMVHDLACVYVCFNIHTDTTGFLT